MSISNPKEIQAHVDECELAQLKVGVNQAEEKAAQGQIRLGTFAVVLYPYAYSMH